MRASELIGVPVFDAHGDRCGVVVEIRTRPNPGDTATPLVVDGLIVDARRWRMFGYERSGEQGPALFSALFRQLHRNARYVGITDVDLEPGRQVRLHRPWDELPTLVDRPRPPE